MKKAERIKKLLEAGNKVISLPEPSDRSYFYTSCQYLGLDGTISKSLDSAGWVGYVLDKPRKPARLAPIEKPPLWSEKPIFSKEGEPLLKFMRVPEPLEDKRFAEDWFFYSTEYMIMVQPRYSERPLECVANLATPVGSMNAENTMVACDEEGKFLGWPLTLARSLRSIPTGTDTILNEVIELAFEHLQELNPEIEEKEFRDLCANEMIFI